MLEDGPLRKRLRERRLLKHSPQEVKEEILFLPHEVAAITGLSEAEARRFLKDVGEYPFLAVVYDDVGKVVDWDAQKDLGFLVNRAEEMLVKRPESRQYKIYESRLLLITRKEKWRW